MDDTQTQHSAEDTGNETELAKPRISGPVLVLLALTLVAVLGLLYAWFATMQNTGTAPTPTAARPTAEENNEPESTTAEAQAGSFQVVSTSDEIEAIEADLESTNLDELDAELNAIDAELEASAQ